MTRRDEPSPTGTLDEEAAAWLTRLRGADRHLRDAFEQWYTADPAHADAYDRVLASWELMGGLRDPAAARPAGRPSRRWAIGALAFVVVAFLGVASVMHVRTRHPQVEMATTRIGEIKTVALTDGSRVVLDTASAIRADFTPDKRTVRLVRGRARFDVAPGRRPFAVITDRGQVIVGRALVDVAVDGGDVDVGLLRGQATVRRDIQNAVFFRLVPGQIVTLPEGGRKPQARRYSASDARWISGMLSFEDAPLSAVVATANRYARSQIALADPGVGRLRFTGTFKASDTAGIARMLAATFGLSCDQPLPGHYILARPAESGTGRK